MMRRLGMVGLVLSAVVLAMVIGPATASAAYDLQITEIWPGNDPGSNLTEDWFEVTNVGDMAWSAALDGDLYFDDASAETADAVLMSGIASIAAGESVVYVDEDAAAAWSDVWDDVVVLPQVGNYDGSGLGQSGDAVTLFIDDLAAGVNLKQIDYESYPDASSNGGQSWDVVLGEFSTVGNASGAVATTMLNDENQPAIGSPGPAVPEPGSAILVILGAAGLLTCRRRQN